MTRYVALLRGVNVGGVAIRMSELSALVAGLGYTEVTTVLASGNVLFTSVDAAAVARHALEAALRTRFGYEAWAHVLTVDTIRSTLDSALGKAQTKPAYRPWLTTRNLNTVEKLTG